MRRYGTLCGLILGLSTVLFAAPSPALLRALAGSNTPATVLNALAARRWADAAHLANAFVKNSPPSARSFEPFFAIDFLSGHLDAARTDARRALAADPANARALRDLGIVDWHEHQPEAAGTELRLAARHAPDDPLTQLYLGDWWFAQRNCAAATAAFARAGVLLGAMPASVVMAARCDLELRRPDAALQQVRVLAQPAPVPPQALFALASDANDRGYFHVAEAALRRLPPDYPDARTHALDLAIASAQAGDRRTALPLLRQVLTGGEGNAALYDLFGSLLEEQGIEQKQPALVQQAYAAYRKAILLDPHQTGSFVDIARLALKLGNYDLAEKLLTEGLRQNPQATPLLLLRGVSYAFSSHDKQAAADFAHARAIDPADPVTYLSQGLLALQQAQFPAAAAVLRQGLTDPQVQTTPSIRAWLEFLLASALYKQSGPPAPAAEMSQAIQRAVQLQPSFAEAWDLDGRIQERMGRALEAKQAFTTAHRLDPHNSHYVYELAMLHRKEGDQKAAAEDFRRFHALEAAYDAARVRKYLMRIVVAPSPARTAQEARSGSSMNSPGAKP